MKHDFIQANADGGLVLNGSVAAKLAATNFNVNALRPYIGGDGRTYVTTYNEGGEPIAVPLHQNVATLREDEWEEMDRVLLEISRARLQGVGDLESRGLSLNLTNGFGTTIFKYERVSDMNDAEMNMDGQADTQNDRVVFDTVSLPMPITHKDFQIGGRALAASRNIGEPLDFTQLATSARKVADKIESVLFTGSGTYKFAGATIYGYMDYPDRNTGSITADWDDSAASGTTILNDVRSMKQASINAKHYGPWMLYIPTKYETVLDDDFKAGSDRSIRERILAVSGIIDIKVADSMGSVDEVLLVEMSAETVRIINGMEITNVEWDSKGGMVFNYKVMAIKVPQIRSDQDGNCGIVHYS